MSERRLDPRIAALFAGAAFALHQLRYAIGYGGRSHHELAAQGHAYLEIAGPVLAVVLMLVIADFGARLLGARAGGRSGAAPRLSRMWLVTTASLLCAYALQESIEGAVAAGHPPALVGLLGHGGWVAMPLAAVLGLVIALLIGGSRRALELAAEPPVRVARPRAVIFLARRLPHPAARVRWMARPLGARGPPQPVTA